MLITHMTPLAYFIQLPPLVLRLAAVLAMFANRLIQILLGSLYISAAAVILVGLSRNGCAG